MFNTHTWIAELDQQKMPIQALLLHHSVKSVDESSKRAGSAADEHRPSPRVIIGDGCNLCKSKQRHTAKREREGEAQLRRVRVRARA